MSQPSSDSTATKSEALLVRLLTHVAIDLLVLGLVLGVLNRQNNRLIEMDRRIQQLEKRLGEQRASTPVNL